MNIDPSDLDDMTFHGAPSGDLTIAEALDLMVETINPWTSKAPIFLGCHGREHLKIKEACFTIGCWGVSNTGADSPATSNGNQISSKYHRDLSCENYG